MGLGWGGFYFKVLADADEEGVGGDPGEVVELVVGGEDFDAVDAFLGDGDFEVFVVVGGVEFELLAVFFDEDFGAEFEGEVDVEGSFG